MENQCLASISDIKREKSKEAKKQTKISREKEGKDEICQEDYSLQRRLFKVTLREPQF